MALVVTEQRTEPAPGSTAPTMALARAAAQGDSAATGQLLRRSPRASGGSCARCSAAGTRIWTTRSSSRSSALFRRSLRFVATASPSATPTIIAVRTAVATRKRSRTDQSRREDGVEADLMEAHHPSPGEEAAASHRKALLRGLLDDLPSEQAEALAMRVVLGWSIRRSRPIAARRSTPCAAACGSPRKRSRAASKRMPT